MLLSISNAYIFIRRGFTQIVSNEIFLIDVSGELKYKPTVLTISFSLSLRLKNKKKCVQLKVK